MKVTYLTIVGYKNPNIIAVKVLLKPQTKALLSNRNSIILTMSGNFYYSP